MSWEVYLFAINRGKLESQPIVYTMHSSGLFFINKILDVFICSDAILQRFSISLMLCTMIFRLKLFVYDAFQRTLQVISESNTYMKWALRPL